MENPTADGIHTFTNFDNGYVIKDENTTVGNSGNSAVHAVRYGNGKAVWFNTYSRDNRDANSLLQAVLFWMAEDFDAIQPPGFSSNLPVTYFTTSFLLSKVGEVFDIYKVDIIIWPIF